jgi:hypothetical protein
MKKLETDKNHNHRGKYSLRSINNQIPNSPNIKSNIKKPSFCSSQSSCSSLGSSIKTSGSRESEASYSGSSTTSGEDLNGSGIRSNNKTLAQKQVPSQPKPREITVNVTTIMGKVIPIQIQITGTIAQLKDLISEEAGISPESQMLVFCGKRLTDNTQILKNLNIQDQSNLQLVLKMAGGLLCKSC